MSADGAGQLRLRQVVKWLMASLGCVVIGVVAYQAWQRFSSAPLDARAGADTMLDGARGAKRRWPTSPRGIEAASGSEHTPQALVGHVENARGSRLSGAHVCWLQGGVSLLFCTLSDTSGAFVLEYRPAGAVALFASASGHVSQPFVLSKAAPSPGAASREDFRLAATRSDGALVLRLEPGGVELTGTVLDALGGGVPAALVSALTPSSELLGAATSDGEGRFRLSVPAGALELRAQAESYSPARAEVRAPAEGLLISLIPASALAGQVLSANGAAVAGVRISATSLDAPALGPISALSDARGQFRMEPLPAGRYSLEAVARAWRSTPQPVSLGVGETLEGFELRVSPAGTLVAQVQVDGAPCAGYLELRGPVASFDVAEGEGAIVAQGLPFGAYQVSVGCRDRAHVPVAEELQMDAPELGRTWNLEEGDAEPGPEERTEGAALGRIVIRIADAAIGHGQFLGASVASATWAGAGAVGGGQWLGDALVFDELELGSYDVYLSEVPSNRQRVVLTHAGESFDVVLQAPERGSIAGRLLDEGGAGLPDVWVHASRDDERSAGALVKPALTDAEGNFTLPGLVPGEYSLRADAATGRARLRAVQTGVLDAALRVTSAGTLRGTLTSETGLAEAFTLLYRRVGAREVHRTAGMGRWELGHVPAGSYELVAVAASGFAAQAVLLEPGATLEIALAVSPSERDALPAWAKEQLHREDSMFAHQ